MLIKEEQQKPATIEEVREQFEQWRQTRVKRTAIPEHLWAVAINLSENHSVNEISKTLRLNYAELKKRIKQSRYNLLPDTIQTKFIGFETQKTEPAEYIIETTNRNGTSMKAHIKGSHIDFLELSKAFWGSAK
jgi:hypothetical protein